METIHEKNINQQPITEIDKLALIYIKDRKILSSRSTGKSTWYLPGGKREKGENDMEALAREIREELNVELVLSSIKYMGVFKAQADSHASGVIVKMTCYTGEYSGTLQPANEIEEIGFLTLKDKDKSSPVDKLILQHLFGLGLID
jgi:8-oxo-dGTP pyrophosphatase MutT (NUDIX family)